MFPAEEQELLVPLDEPEVPLVLATERGSREGQARCQRLTLWGFGENCLTASCPAEGQTR